MGRLHRDMLRVLIDEIVSGEHAAGAALPREVDLADRFGVSRGVVRECLRALEERDLISVRHGRGATVRPAQDWNVLDADVVAAMLQSPGGNAVLLEYIECRRSLEVEAAGLAAQRADREDLRRLSEAFEAMKDTAAKVRAAESVGAAAVMGAEERFHHADVEFHQAVLDAARNRALSHMLRPVNEALVLARIPLARPHIREERGLPEHERILTAIVQQDEAAARAAMAAHLSTVRAYLDEQMVAVTA